MKSKLFVLVAILGISISSCKNEEKQTQEVEVADANAKQNFNVEIDATTTVKDDFAVYFTEDGTNNFTGDQTAWRGISGSGSNEKLVFELSEENIPTLIRLDFGMNKEQGDIVIKNIKMDYYGNDFSFQGSDFFTYFIKTDEFQTEVNPSDGTMTILKGKEGFKTPYFYPTQALIDAIAKITTAKK